jgi:hypothetical protein
MASYKQLRPLRSLHRIGRALCPPAKAKPVRVPLPDLPAAHRKGAPVCAGSADACDPPRCGKSTFVQDKCEPAGLSPDSMPQPALRCAAVFENAKCTVRQKIKSVHQ